MSIFKTKILNLKVAFNNHYKSYMPSAKETLQNRTRKQIWLEVRFPAGTGTVLSPTRSTMAVRHISLPIWRTSRDFAQGKIKITEADDSTTQLVSTLRTRGASPPRQHSYLHGISLNNWSVSRPVSGFYQFSRWPLKLGLTGKHVYVRLSKNRTASRELCCFQSLTATKSLLIYHFLILSE
jgi:hypothetical protein